MDFLGWSEAVDAPCEHLDALQSQGELVRVSERPGKSAEAAPLPSALVSPKPTAMKVEIFT